MSLSTSSITSTDSRRSRALPREGIGVTILGWVGLLGLVGAQIFSFTISAPDRDMGDLQKIMYVHVPAAWLAFVAFFVVFVASLIYLWRRDQRSDLVASSAAEVGVVLTRSEERRVGRGGVWGGGGVD